MKRSLITAFILMALALISLPLAAMRADSGKERITITEECLAGDPAAAAGVTLQIASHWDKRLLWNTEYTIGGEKGAESKFTFSKKQASWGWTSDRGAGLYLRFSPANGWISTGSNTSYDSSSAEYYTALDGADTLFPDAVRAVAERTREGEKRTETVRIGDYYDCWPLGFTIEGSSVAYEGYYNEALDYLSDFFRIPTADAQLQVTLEKNVTGDIISVKMRIISNDACTSIANLSAFGGEGIYYSYYLRRESSREAADPGQNYGLFYFPYEQDEKSFLHIDLTQVRRLCDLPAGLLPIQMLLSEEGSLLYLLGKDGEDYRLLVYTLEGGAPVLAQQLWVYRNSSSSISAAGAASSGSAAADAVSSNPALAGTQDASAPSPSFYRMSLEDGGILMTWSDGSFSFVTREDGQHRWWCGGSFPENSEQLYSQKLFPQENVCAFDGERLVLAAFDSLYSLNVLLTVCREGEQVYCGLYRHSGNESAVFGGGMLLPIGQPDHTWFGRYSREAPLKLRIGGSPAGE
ncbi:MAG: hypothetical protein K2N94_02900 [Lachnospiraceae bacterium]|nr:hypothetical protein [Lachnospiraceae bacterium]